MFTRENRFSQVNINFVKIGFPFWFLGSILQQKTQSTIGVEKQETFFQRVFEWGKRHTVLEVTTICTLPQATPYSLFHDKVLPFVEKKIYRRHNNLMTGVVWRTWRSNITSRIFCVFEKVILGGNIDFSQIENWNLFSVTFCNLTTQSGKRRE